MLSSFNHEILMKNILKIMKLSKTFFSIIKAQKCWEMLTFFFSGMWDSQLRMVEDMGEVEVKNWEKVVTSFMDDHFQPLPRLNL